MRYGLKEILDLGEAGGFAVPAFNVYNLETVLGIMKAAEETGVPVIFQMYSRLFDSEVAQYVAPIIREAMDNMKTPVAFHLDHGAGIPEVLRAFRCGATGVMIDASREPMEKNIEITKNIVDMAAEMGITVEGELGLVGKAADGVSTDYTRVEDDSRFVESTGVCALAVAVATAHGHYRQAPMLAIDRIRELHAGQKAHLVLHGGSGVPDDQIQAAVKAGIRKVNFGTDVCCSLLDGIRAVDPSILALDLFMKEPTNRVKDFAISKIKLLGADR